MELNDIISALNTNIRPDVGTLVLHRSMIVHDKFKVYKNFKYDLYLVDKNKNKECIFTYNENKHTPANEIERVWQECDKLYLKVILKWVASNDYRKLTEDGIE